MNTDGHIQSEEIRCVSLAPDRQVHGVSIDVKMPRPRDGACFGMDTQWRNLPHTGTHIQNPQKASQRCMTIRPTKGRAQIGGTQFDHTLFNTAPQHGNDSGNARLMRGRIHGTAFSGNRQSSIDTAIQRQCRDTEATPQRINIRIMHANISSDTRPSGNCLSMCLRRDAGT
jgi:hypothetical protein